MAKPAPETSDSDEALLALFYAGQQSAFAVLYERYWERTLRYAWRMLRRREEAEELCAEVWMQLAQGVWKPTGMVRSFLFTLLHRRCLDRLRRRQRRLRLLPWGRQEPASAQTPEEAAVHSERLCRLERALAGLSEQHRTAVLLFYVEGLSSQQVAQAMGCSDQQLRSRLSYARRLLKEELVLEEQYG